MLSQIRHSRRARVACCGALALVALGRFQAPLRAQQREPAIEVYGLAGAYFFGNSSNLLKNGAWRPQIALGALFPVGPKWAVLVDGSRSRLQVQEGLHSPAALPARQRSTNATLAFRMRITRHNGCSPSCRRSSGCGDGSDSRSILAAAWDSSPNRS